MSTPERDDNAYLSVEVTLAPGAAATSHGEALIVMGRTGARLHTLSAWLRAEGFVNMAIHVDAAANIVEHPEQIDQAPAEEENR